MGCENQKSYGVKPLRVSDPATGVSVITPAHNAVTHLRETVASVAAQALPVLEHIVVDDGSTDGTLALLEQLQEEHPHLEVVRQRNRGAGAARNTGIEAARGRYIAFLDSDDVWLPGKLASQVGFMGQSGAVFTYGDYVEAEYGTGRELKRHSPPATLEYGDLLNSCPIGCLTAAYDQHALGKLYMPLARRGQDWALWLKITRDGTVAQKYPGCEAVYHRVSASLSSSKLRKCMDMYQIYRRHESLPPLRALWHLGRFSLSVLRK
ncbi:MAG: glycosyltransferase family 2 protein [Ectothiorhodospiraceae bacterium]|nr:glycosyltransferase family 2 protein [Ectothiorhodospiraceae bacterium]MCH8504315.1 glycosyltransferase [Ectothiorhodospiraceae bacterium]